MQIQPRAVQLLGHPQRLLRGPQQLLGAVRVGQRPGDVAGHRGERRAGLDQGVDVLLGPVPDLDLEPEVGDPPDPLLERQVGEHHLGRDGQPVGAAGVDRSGHLATSAIRTGRPARTDSAAARAMASAARASSPPTGAGPPARTASTNAASSATYATARSSWSLRAVSTARPAGPANTMPLRRPSPIVAIPPEPNTSPRTSYPYVASKQASATPTAPLSNRTVTTAVSSRPRSRQSGSTSASATAYTSTASAPGLRNRSVSKSWINVSLKIVSGATREGSKPPGSRVTDRTNRGMPSVPLSSSARAAAQSGANRRLNPICSTTPAARAASIARSMSARLSAAGFSQNTALPAPAAATISSAWNRDGAAMTTASTAGSANACAASVYAESAPSVPASFSAAPGIGSAIAVSRAAGSRCPSVAP